VAAAKTLAAALAATALLLAAALALHHSSPHYPMTVYKPVTAEEYARMLGVGINVNWINYNKTRSQYFHWRSMGVNIPLIFRQRGFNNVRIRVGSEAAENPQALKQLEEIVDDCLKAGIIPIIAYKAEELRNNPTDPEAIEHFKKWWKTIAEHFKNKPYLLSYDLIIESSGPLKNHPEILNRVYNETIRIIRSIDRYRIIIVTPANTSKPHALGQLRIKWDPYIMAEFHIYAKGPCPPRRERNETSPHYDTRLIDEAIEEAADWSKKNRIPVWMGAWRPNCYRRGRGGAKPVYTPSQVLPFVEYMTTRLCRSHIPFDINADTHFFNITSLEWYPQQEKILNTILECKPKLRSGKPLS